MRVLALDDAMRYAIAPEAPARLVQQHDAVGYEAHPRAPVVAERRDTSDQCSLTRPRGAADHLLHLAGGKARLESLDALVLKVAQGEYIGPETSSGIERESI